MASRPNDYERTPSVTFEVMEEELDALLADLQSHVPNVGSSPSPTYQVDSQQTTVTTTSSKNLQSNNDYYNTQNQNIYQNEEFSNFKPQSPLRQENALLHNTTNGRSHNGVPEDNEMYKHETREEIRTETHSSGPNLPPPRAAISNNLTELDSLLQDLNTAKKTGVFKDNSVFNGTRPSVDSLLNELNNVGRTETIEHRSTTTYKTPVAPPIRTSQASASNATRELDDLMASLSDFKKKKRTEGFADQETPNRQEIPKVSQATVTLQVRKLNASNLQNQVDNTYAKPQRPKPPTPTPPPPEPPQKNQLDSMLGSLTSHMTEQGVTTTPKGSCSACDKPIIGSVITALGKPWHPEHFVCVHCHQELGTKNFFERDGKPYCEQDYHELFSPKCAYCSAAILDKCVTALNKTWHPEHFFCAQCGNTFGEEGFHEKNGKSYCKDCYFNQFAPKCGGCNSPIMENYISALNAQWHPECFVCRDCRQPFNGGSFFDHEGLPYCETHYHAKRGSLCAGCHKPITGRCITAMFRKYHPEHFVCAFCLQQLNKGTFKEQNDKPYCHTCFDKLFG